LALKLFCKKLLTSYWAEAAVPERQLNRTLDAIAHSAIGVGAFLGGGVSLYHWNRDGLSNTGVPSMALIAVPLRMIFASSSDIHGRCYKTILAASTQHKRDEARLASKALD